jgi:hypothetical protein
LAQDCAPERERGSVATLETVEYALFPPSVELEPLTSDDWELVLSHPEVYETEILRQVTPIRLSR